MSLAGGLAASPHAGVPGAGPLPPKPLSAAMLRARALDPARQLPGHARLAVVRCQAGDGPEAGGEPRPTTAELALLSLKVVLAASAASLVSAPAAQAKSWQPRRHRRRIDPSLQGTAPQPAPAAKKAAEQGARPGAKRASAQAQPGPLSELQQSVAAGYRRVERAVKGDSVVSPGPGWLPRRRRGGAPSEHRN